jgi:tRNA-splicing ligase RtcB
MNHRESSWLFADEELGKAYWNHHNAAGNYASANRHIIGKSIAEAIQEVYAADCLTYYEISHNLIQFERLPSGLEGFVHRKGATRAFPVIEGFDLPNAGHPCLIPGSMYDGAAVLIPQKGAISSGFSVNHGSGRVLGRKEAKRRFAHKHERIDEQMNTVVRRFDGVAVEGITLNSKHVPLDECSLAYKNLDDVISVLTTENVASLERRLYPVLCLKGND